MESGHPEKILIMCLADPGGNPRPRRAIELCRSLGFHVSVMGYPTQKDLKVKEFFPLSLPSLALRSKFYRKISALLLDFLPFKKNEGLARRLWAFRYDLIGAEEMLQGREFDLLIVEDLQFLPLAFAVKGNAKILFDAREYYPRQNEGEWRFHLFEKRGRMQLCRDYLTRCDTVLTVSEGLQREYRKEFGITAELYRSTPSYADRIVQSTNPEKIRMVYHGKANRNRRLENLIDIVSMLDERFSLDLILVGNPPYQKELRRKAVLSKRIFFPEPVPFTEIIPTVGQYDIGFFYCEPTTFNLENCLPNKFFEYIQARLMIAIGPSPDMAKLVRQYECGVVAEEFSLQSMAKALNALSASDIDRTKHQSHKAARELCFEKEQEKLVALLNRLLEESNLFC